jgi:hypothetical protein
MKPLVFTACLIMLLTGVSSAQTNTTSKGSIIRGRVNYDDTDNPARRLGVALFSDSKTRNQQTTFTDAKGEIESPANKTGTSRQTTRIIENNATRLGRHRRPVSYHVPDLKFLLSDLIT